MATRGRNKGKKAPGAQNLTIIPDFSVGAPSVYSNYASVSHTASEFCVDFCLVGTPYKIDLDSGEVTAPVVARVRFPPIIISGLIKALEAQKEKQGATAKSGNLVIPLPKPKKGRR